MKRIVSFCALLVALTIGAQPTVSYKNLPDNQAELIVSFKLLKNDLLYHDFFSVSANSPDVTIDNWEIDSKPIEQFDADFKETKKMYLKDISVIIHLTYLKPTSAHIHLNYYQKSNKKIDALSIPISSSQESQEEPSQEDSITLANTEMRAQKTASPQESSKSWSDTIGHIVETTNSLWIRLLFALILGLLLSLTPCIYPMIPITVGILQAQGTKSLFKNFLLAATYTIGIATTFALLGLTAAFTGQIFGSLLAKPLFVGGLVLFLLYLAGSMIGFYDMYIPAFLQPRSQQYKGGSIISVFLFGAVSGTIASPCLSPGLFLLLTLVTTIGSKLIGFLLLFAFGIGLGIPLLIIGTFSSSLNVLPSAGMWMIEIKKFFGFIMIGMCFFYLKNVMNPELLLWIISGTLLLAGIFYLRQAQTVRGWKKVYNILGTIVIIASVATTFKAFQALHPIVEKAETVVDWETDYTVAHAQALTEKKKIFVDITAPFCSICKAIDKKILSNPAVVSHLKHFVTMKIDNKETNEQHAKLQEQWSIKGVPAFLIIDPETDAIIARFGAEMHDWSPEEFIQKVNV
jgi:thioredoxin:protein disulfide reductase